MERHTVVRTPVKDALAYLCATFRAEVDSWQVRAYEKALQGIPAPVVMAAAEALVEEAAQGRKFFPLPTAPDWKRAAQARLQRLRADVAKAALSACEHDGWEQVEEDGVWKARRCACHQQAMQAMLAVAPDVPVVALLTQGDDDGRE